MSTVDWGIVTIVIAGAFLLLSVGYVAGWLHAWYYIKTTERVAQQ